jgi:hypothetical protein
MAVTIKALNNDTCFLLTFYPPYAPKEAKSPELFPGAYTILVDPWLTGSAEIIGPRFSKQEHVSPSCIASLTELAEPDMIIISQHQPDHCHRETLCQLSPDVRSMILGTPAAAKIVRKWKHFDSSSIRTLRKYNEKRPETVFRVEIPPFSPSGSPGEVTVTLLEPKYDMYGVHNAIGITYRPPCSVLSLNMGSYVDLPKSPASPTAELRPKFPRVISATANTISPSPYNNHERTISLVYSPHGVTYEAIKPWASSHLVNEAALPLAALIHSFVQVDIPWYMGGNMASGCPGGLEIAKHLLPKVWIGAHDEKKKVGGFATRNISRKEFDLVDVEQQLRDADTTKSKSGSHTKVMTLESGKEFCIEAR